MAKAFPLLTVDPTGTLADNMPLILHVRLSEMIFFSRRVADPERVTELHSMRIAAKRLRYTMELVLPYMQGPSGKAMAGLLDKTKKIQELIGEVHDRDVRIPLIMEFVRHCEPDRPEIRLGLMRLAEQERGERERIYNQFVAFWSDQREKYIARLIGSIGAMGSRSPADSSEST
jgi:CHAD domain-containing protein